MSVHFELSGPFYVELAYEVEGEAGGERIRTAYIDGIGSEAEAWRACGRLRAGSIAAVSDKGDAVAIAPAQVLQLVISRKDAAAFAVAAE